MRNVQNSGRYKMAQSPTVGHTGVM